MSKKIKNRGLITKVARFEIVRQVKKPAFWVSLLLAPLMMVVIFLISFFSASDAEKSASSVDYNDTKIAITDDAGVLGDKTPFAINGDKEYGIEMVKKGETDLYFYIPKDFGESKKAELYHVSEGLDLFNNDGSVLKSILMNTVRERVGTMDAMVLTGGYEIQDTKLTATGAEENALGKAVIPLLILITFFLFVCLFGSRLLMTVVEEKENRISEMILATVSAKHLIVGKIIAMMALGLIQIASFILPVLGIVFLYRENPMVSSVLSMIEFDPVSIIINIVLFCFSILLFSGFSMFVGTLSSTARDASSFFAPIMVGTMMPFYFLQAFFVAEPTFMVRFLTFFPLSSPTAMMLRNACGNLSTPELIIGVTEIVVLAIIMIALTIRMFQKGAVNFETIRPKLFKRK